MWLTPQGRKKTRLETAEKRRRFSFYFEHFSVCMEE